MNKTVNINLGGMFFHIDEDAYQKLTRYFDAIKRSLSNSNGKDEIIKDIEMRIAELVSEKHSNDKQVINIKELDEIIAVMGQPEDYRIDPDGEEETRDFNATATVNGRKKLYRDKDGGMIGGVLSGLGYYFGIDKVWLRIILLIAVCFYGTGILAYVILWIVMPEAVTTTEKLEMQGEPITISNIEKKVREEFDSVSEKFKNANYDKMGNQVKTGAEKIGSSFGDFILTVLKIFAKFLGVLLIISSLVWMLILFIGVFTLGTPAFIQFPWQELAGNLSDYPAWSFGLLIFVAIGIPFFFLFLLGLKLLSPNMQSIGNIAKYTLLALWLIALGILISIGIQQATEYAVEGIIIKKETIQLAENDTLFVKFRHSDYFTEDIHNRDFLVTEDSTNNKVIYSNEVSLKIMKTDEKLPYLQIDRYAKGPSLSVAKKTAEKIKYGYSIVGNRLILDNYLITDFKNKFRDQEVEITLYLPTGIILRPDSSLQDYDRSDDSFFNLHYSGDYTYKVENSKVTCLDCPADENEYDDIEGISIDSLGNDEDTSASITLNKDGILIKKSNSEEAKEVKSVKINDDGIIIKTK